MLLAAGEVLKKAVALLAMAVRVASGGGNLMLLGAGGPDLGSQDRNPVPAGSGWMGREGLH